MEMFERRQTFGKMPTYSAADGHDDFMMSTIWALYSLSMDIIERYYDVRKIAVNRLRGADAAPRPPIQRAARGGDRRLRVQAGQGAGLVQGELRPA